MANSADVPEKAANGPGLLHRNINKSHSTPDTDCDVYPPLTLKPTQLLFAGRLGGNQEFIIDRDDPAQAALLQKTPDAAPFMSLRQTFDLRGFREVDLWKAAFIEGIGEFFPSFLYVVLEEEGMLGPPPGNLNLAASPSGEAGLRYSDQKLQGTLEGEIEGRKRLRLTITGTMLLVFLTVWISLSPSAAAIPTPATAAGVFATTPFLGALVGGVSNVILLSLFIFAFSPVSGGHLNPNITIATFFARLTSLPRMVLYVAFQTVGAILAGLLIRATYGSRDFVAGGCAIDTTLVPVGDAFALEFICDLALLFMSFGVGLDPRQRQVFGPALGPILVGLVLGILSFGTSFTRRGYNGVSANPARCLGVFVGSRFPRYHWIHWVGAILADIVHGVVYFVAPPWQYSKSRPSSPGVQQSSA
jgi:glycerol uptake facilitator-like aquaporin